MSLKKKELLVHLQNKEKYVVNRTRFISQCTYRRIPIYVYRSAECVKGLVINYGEGGELSYTPTKRGRSRKMF